MSPLDAVMFFGGGVACGVLLTIFVMATIYHFPDKQDEQVEQDD